MKKYYIYEKVVDFPQQHIRKFIFGNSSSSFERVVTVDC